VDSLPAVPSFSQSIEVNKPPAEAFPWLLDLDKVPQWTTEVATYELVTPPPMATGSQMRQALRIGGSTITLEHELTRYDPPSGAEVRFSTNGVDVVNVFTVEAIATGSRITQTLDATATSFGARMVIPVIQGRLEQKLAQDLGKLKELLNAA
jgi:Polyketide cyclase / dehydrase and lipid transport